ncbi:hypothetical protein [Sulfobacillus harzensis]|uniref:Uncharacterized protein n=1 Tax=Sulfobacillus harzensis TaxID=2729629 RepID=A0A7Y0L2E4_9FIRM|nr:hypothetical protein [Sulfobacillus harzensis]NMP22043.1 hypothetical protein [Sulfobacillus harzensis]
MTPESRTLSPWHYATLLISATIGNILFVWPGHVVSAAGENAAASVLVIVAGIGGIGLVHHAWVQQHPPPLAGAARFAVIAIAVPGLPIVGAQPDVCIRSWCRFSALSCGAPSSPSMG